MDAFPDLATLGDADLKRLIDELQREETEVSYERRMLQGEIEIKRSGASADVESLTAALTRKAEAADLSPEELVEEGGPALEEVAGEGPALVVRSGGGRAGETFHPNGERTLIGRSPDCDVFLDDVTVSRKHAVLLQRDDGFFIEDQGSLN